MTIARRFLYDTSDAVRLEALADGSWAPLAELVGKLAARGALPPDARGHVARAPGPERTASRASGCSRRWRAGPGCGDRLHAARRRGRSSSTPAILAAPMTELEARWRASIAPTFDDLDLPMPPPATRPGARPARPRRAVPTGCGASSRRSAAPTRERRGERGRHADRDRTGARAGAVAGRCRGRATPGRRGRRPRGARRGDGPGAADAVRRRPRDRPSRRGRPGRRRDPGRDPADVRRLPGARADQGRRSPSRLAAFGRPVEVTATFEVPWTSDRISPAGRAALAAAGIAPPGPARTARPAPRPDRSRAAGPVPALRVTPDRRREPVRADPVPDDPLLRGLSPAIRIDQDRLMSRAAPVGRRPASSHRRDRRGRDDGRRDRPGRPRSGLRGRPLRRRRGGPRARTRADPRRPDPPRGEARSSTRQRPTHGWTARLDRLRHVPILDGLADEGGPRHRGAARGPRAEADDLPDARRRGARPR